jgi:hypothetical protein
MLDGSSGQVTPPPATRDLWRHRPCPKAPQRPWGIIRRGLPWGPLDLELKGAKDQVMRMVAGARYSQYQ